MIPTFEFLGHTISPYMITAVLGILAVLVFALLAARKAGLELLDLLLICAFSLPAVFLGASLVFGLTNIPYLVKVCSNYSRFDSFGAFLRAFLEAFRGGVFYGGLLGVLLVLWIYRRKKHLSPRYSDLVGAAVPLFHMFGRIGCFLTGCCFGVECTPGVVYHYCPIPGVNGVSRLPVQLFEAIFNLLLFAVLAYFFWKDRHEGWLLQIYLFAYPLFRFINEFFRGDTYRGILWGLSTSQWISLLILAGNTFVVIKRLREKKKKPSGAES